MIATFKITVRLEKDLDGKPQWVAIVRDETRWGGKRHFGLMPDGTWVGGDRLGSAASAVADELLVYAKDYLSELRGGE